MYRDAAPLDRPIVGIRAVQMRGRAAVELHGQLNAAGKVKGHPFTGRGLVQHFPGQGAEILYQEAVAARRDDAAAGLRAREAETLEGNGLVSRVNEPLCGSRGREACADDDNVCCPRLGHLFATSDRCTTGSFVYVVNAS